MVFERYAEELGRVVLAREALFETLPRRPLLSLLHARGQ
jgi:hypothetical protein